MLLFHSVACLALTPWGLPSYVDISAYAVNDYLNVSDLPRSIPHKDRFIHQFQARLISKYPNIFSNVRHDRNNSLATVYNYMNDNTNMSEIVFSAGHGSYGGIWMYDGFISSASGKAFGGYTRWVFMDACLALNLSLPDAYRWFNGVHAILGNRSIGWQFIHSYNCFFTCDHYRSEDQYNVFAYRFITNGETIWSAYAHAVMEVIYLKGGHGIEPAIINLAGNADNGQYVDFLEERLQNVYNGPFGYPYGATNITVFGRSISFGTPEY